MLALLVAVAGEQLQDRLAVRRRLVDVEDAVLLGDQRRQLGEDQPGDGQQVALALQQPGEAGDVRLQPVLLRVDPRRIAQVADHLVDVVLERRDLARPPRP